MQTQQVKPMTVTVSLFSRECKLLAQGCRQLLENGITQAGDYYHVETLAAALDALAAASLAAGSVPPNQAAKIEQSMNQAGITFSQAPESP